MAVTRTPVSPRGLAFVIVGLAGLCAGAYWLYPLMTKEPEPATETQSEADMVGINLEEPLDVAEQPAVDTSEAGNSLGGIGLFFDDIKSAPSAGVETAPSGGADSILDPSDLAERLSASINGTVSEQAAMITESPLARSIKAKKDSDFLKGVNSAVLWSNELLITAADERIAKSQAEATAAKPVKVESVLPAASEDWVVAKSVDRELLKSLHKTGDPEAGYLLARHALYAEGNPKAHGYAEVAAMKGHPGAMWLLGEMFNRGIFIPKNPEYAYGWLTVSEAFGVKEAAAPRVALTANLDAVQAQQYQHRAAWLLDRLTQDALAYAKAYKESPPR